ncbi:MAG: hypothetical protein P8184_17540 [Calditrichia bacterium]
MAKSLQEHVKELSDTELSKYITDHKRYRIEAVETALDELRRRGRYISDSELAAMRDAIKQKEAERKAQLEKDFSFTNWKRNIVDDPNAAELYSERAIWFFSVAMLPLFGSILFSMNLYRLGKNKFISPIILFGIIWLALALTFLPRPPRMPVVYIFNGFGCLAFQYFFWPKFVGKEFKYRRRPIWVPLVIAILITGLTILAAISGGEV